jgi:hypothetical protein
MLSQGIRGSHYRNKIRCAAARERLARDLFREDSAIYYQDLLKYEVPERKP